MSPPLTFLPQKFGGFVLSSYICSVNELTNISSLIYEIRGQKVMLDFDLARMYGVETKQLNQSVKRNKERFPIDFMFQLNQDEFNNSSFGSKVI